MTETTTTSNTWTELATLNVPAKEVTAYISIISRVRGVAVGTTSPTGTSRGEVRITIDDVQQITCTPAWPFIQEVVGSEVFMTYFYEPSGAQKQNGFAVKIEGRRVDDGNPGNEGRVIHFQTDIWGM